MVYSHTHSSRFGSGGRLRHAEHVANAFLETLFATTLFRCIHIIVFYTAWATLVTCINEFKVANLTFPSVLLTVVGTVLGFVVSYRTTSSFERYNEGRRLWSQIILASRTFARTVWFHVPDVFALTPGDDALEETEEERLARNIVQKKTMINLVEAFAVAVKHHLRGEEGIEYVDLYHLVKFLPAYSTSDSGQENFGKGVLNQRKRLRSSQTSHSFAEAEKADVREDGKREDVPHVTLDMGLEDRNVDAAHGAEDNVKLLPASLAPKFNPLRGLVSMLSNFFQLQTEAKKLIRERKLDSTVDDVGHVIARKNVPLQISLYLTSYVAMLGARKYIDVSTSNLISGSINMLMDSLSGLERILTTPLPFSYQFHLQLVTAIYVLALPLQIYSTMGWVTIPATTVVSFFFFGFIVAGREIENPFGYDLMDLNLDHFTHDIIRNELHALTSMAPIYPDEWTYSPRNDRLFESLREDRTSTIKRGVAPDLWVHRGVQEIREALGR